MGKERSAAFYNRGYRKNARYKLDADHAPWSQLWYWVLGRTSDEMIVDLGCGAGHLAELLQRRDHPTHRYMGLDFSEEALKQARKRAPGYRFICGTLPRDVRQVVKYKGATVVLTEVLEHIKKDQALLKALRVGTRVLGTVPQKDSASHVRFFQRMREVVIRYEGLLELRSIEEIGNAYAFEGVRRERVKRP